MTLSEILALRKAASTENLKLEKSQNSFIITTSNETVQTTQESYPTRDRLLTLLCLFEAASYNTVYCNNLAGFKLLAQFLGVPLLATPTSLYDRRGRNDTKLLGSYTRNEVEKLLGFSVVEEAILIESIVNNQYERI